MELAISIAIDPVAGTRPKPAPEQPITTPPPPEPAAPAPIIVYRPSPPPATHPPETRPPSVPTVIGASAGAVGAFRAAPATTLGVTVQASLRRGAVSAGLEGRADLPVAATLRMGEVRTSLLTGSLVPCWHARVFAACILVAGGAMRASGHDLVDAQHVTVPFLAAGGRIAVELPTSGPLFVRLHADVLAPLTETVLRVSGTAVWSSPPVSAALGLAVGARFR